RQKCVRQPALEDRFSFDKAGIRVKSRPRRMKSPSGCESSRADRTEHRTQNRNPCSILPGADETPCSRRQEFRVSPVFFVPASRASRLRRGSLYRGARLRFSAGGAPRLPPRELAVVRPKQARMQASGERISAAGLWVSCLNLFKWERNNLKAETESVR